MPVLPIQLILQAFVLAPLLIKFNSCTTALARHTNGLGIRASHMTVCICSYMLPPKHKQALTHLSVHLLHPESQPSWFHTEVTLSCLEGSSACKQNRTQNQETAKFVSGLRWVKYLSNTARQVEVSSLVSNTSLFAEADKKDRQVESEQRARTERFFEQLWAVAHTKIDNSGPSLKHNAAQQITVPRWQTSIPTDSICEVEWWSNFYVAVNNRNLHSSCCY